MVDAVRVFVSIIVSICFTNCHSLLFEYLWPVIVEFLFLACYLYMNDMDSVHFCVRVISMFFIF
jgi:hypothetical protein